MAAGNKYASKLRSMTECSVCLDSFKQPKCLPCVHTFCLDCLKGLGQALTENFMPCPMCRQVFPIPYGGFDKLPGNFLIEQMREILGSREFGSSSGVDSEVSCETCQEDEASKFCLECNQDLCESCALIHGRARGTQTHQVITQEEKNKPSMSSDRASHSYCEIHVGKQLELYCEDCKTAICIKCSALEHGPHLKSDIQQVSEKLKSDIREMMIGIGALTQTSQAELKQIKRDVGEFGKHVSEAEIIIRAKGEAVKRSINTQVGELMEQLEIFETDKMKEIATRKDELNALISVLDNCKKRADELIERRAPHDVIRFSDQLFKTAKEIKASQEDIGTGKTGFLRLQFHEADVRSVVRGSIQLVGTLSAQDHYDKSLVIVGLFDGSTVQQTVCHLHLSYSDAVCTDNSTPTYVSVDAAACTFNDTLYAVGLGETLNQLWKYSPESDWLRLADIPDPIRRKHCVAIVGDKLYVLGGCYDRFMLGDVLRYNITYNTWSTVGQLTHAISSAACVPYRNSVYVFGGQTLNGTTLITVDHIQVYDTVSQKCTLMPNAMPRPDRLMRAVLWKTYVVLLNCFTCFIYDLETQTWLKRDQYKARVGHFGAVLNNDTLYVAGGGTFRSQDDGKVVWTCSDEIKCVSVKDLIEDKPAAWRHHAKLPQPALISVWSSTPMRMCWVSDL